ncbi:tetratricopeptide repeat protein [Gaoshiqia sediminis]|uniref:Tetratricopeptide repeat protein n=1 Tax=Gaoshiqia sediminis TaxID=2986998 RepID=A0AA41YAA5_9BACT|nr:tetratricopeptide repeat protein [Gaoshiqia sediminis]MCW0483868.1 tetratricopeptide repeat protein [Gaoshiqia sediminis]
MKKKSGYIFLLFLVIGFFGGCSTEKNTFVTRAYHNLSSHYNVYFNGKESLNAGVERINTSVEDDYSRILPIYKSSQGGTDRVAQSEMENAILKASKLINMHSITKKPKRRRIRSLSYKKLASKEEYNNWVDDSYLLMGQAFFYQKKFIPAMENFSYVIRKFSNEETKYDAYVWMVRCLTELERYNEALEYIQNMDASVAFPKRLTGAFSLAVADFHMRRHEYNEAIPQLKTAVNNTRRKHERARYKYILAQLYKETEQHALASETFREVSRMNPSYIMAFNARINAAGVFTGESDVEKLKKELRKMLRDEKNTEFRDQIYFALGNIYAKEGQQQSAVDQYVKSAAASSINLFQRALSCLTLADIYFQEQNYRLSQSYYDSAMVVIDNNYPNYNFIADRYKSLTRLTDNLYTIEREDSLQRIAALSDGERNNLIAGWIQQARDEELRKKQAELDEQMDRSFFRMNQARTGSGQQQRGSGWYFYNPSTMAYGKVEFAQTWGNRKLEDNWRRKNKSSAAQLAMEEEEEAEEGTEKPEKPEVPRINDRLSREYYLQDVPLTEEALASSHLKIRDALFNAGRIFKTDYDNYPLAIQHYEELLTRYDNNVYQLTTWFELWDLYKQTGDMTKSNYYRNLIIGNYPDSKYAQYLINPNYFIELEARSDSLNNLYQQAFYQYQQGSYSRAGELARQLKGLSPDSLLLPKVAFIETIADGTSSTMEQFGQELNGYIRSYPRSPAIPLAESILKLIQDSTLVDYQKLVAMGYLNEEIENDELLANDRRGEDEFGGKWSYDEDLLHYFVIAFPREAKVDLNRLKFDLANYNIDHYTRIDFDIETENLNPQTMLLVVRSLESKEQALIYFRSVIRKREVFETLKGIDYVNFVASSLNFREMLGDNNYVDYLKFFIKNYSRFIGGDFPQDELPEPEELMAKALEEENRQEERGTFVLVKPESGKSMFTRDNQAKQLFVIAVNDASFNLRPLMSAFGAYHRENYANESLPVQQRSFAGQQLLVVELPGTVSESMTYFRSVVTTRSLFSELETRSYRNFLITEENLGKLIANGNLEEYMNFFRDYYISGGFTDESAAAVQTPTQPVAVTPVAPEPPAYQGAFKTGETGEHGFVLILPASGVDHSAVVEAIRGHNQQSPETQGLQVQEVPFDAQQVLFRVSSFATKEAGMAYLRGIVRDQQVYGPLAEVNYRNFVISQANYTILLQNKDVSDYLELYRLDYLKP